MITQEEAVQIAAKHHGSGFELFRTVHGAVGVSATLEYTANCRKWYPDNVWCVLCSAHPGKAGLSSSRAIIVDKKTGEILYDGSAEDEG
jgi:D-alanyl-D-alanine carboxypeptidase